MQPPTATVGEDGLHEMTKIQWVGVVKGDRNLGGLGQRPDGALNARTVRGEPIHAAISVQPTEPVGERRGKGNDFGMGITAFKGEAPPAPAARRTTRRG